MKTLTLLTLLLITSSSAVGQTMKSNQTGFVGKDVLLSCNCSNEHNELSWQRGVRIVNVHPQDEKINIDDSYKNRTQLFLNIEKRNCSLLIRNISTEDAGLYTCHDLASVNKVWSRKSSDVFLTVSEKEDVQENHNKLGSSVSAVSAVSVSVPILVVALILAVSLLLTLLIRRRHRTNMDTYLPAGKPMLENV